MLSLFGTDGIRGSLTSPFFSFNSLVHAGAAIGRWASERYGYRPTLIIGYDTRYSAQHIKQALIHGLTSIPVDVLDAHIIPTPAAAHILRTMPHVTAAIIISASHNEAHDNGIKLFNQTTGKLTIDDETTITNYYNEYEARQYVDTIHVAHGCVFTLSHAAHIYAQRLITEIMPTLATRLSLSSYHIVLDTAHGAMSTIAPALFQQYGARVTILHNTPTGYNINERCGSTHPNALQQTVMQEHADIGFAFDGDGDRVIVVNRHGQIKNGDDLLYFLLSHPDYLQTPSLVGTIMTNGGLEHALQQHNKTLLRTPVGDRFIMDKLNTEHLILGGEPVGHIILRNHLFTGDGLLVALKVLETMSITHNVDIETFTHHAQVAHKLPVHIRYSLTQEPFAAIIEHAQQRITPGRMLVRYSGTESVLRITAESQELSHAQQECATLVHILEHAFKELS